MIRFHARNIPIIPGALTLLYFLPLLAFTQNVTAPNVEMENLDGSVTHLAQYLSNGPVYLTFWALWCEPCKQELHALKSFGTKSVELRFTIIAVNQDSPRSLAKVKAFVRSQGYPFVIILDPDAEVFQAFNGQNIPFSVLIDQSGEVVSTRTGYFPGDEKDIEREIRGLLAK